MSAGAASSEQTDLLRALPSLLGPSPSPTRLTASTLHRERRARQPRLLSRAADGEVLGDRQEQALGGKRDLVDRPLECLMVLPRRLAEAAHLAHELACGSADLLIGGDYVSLAQSLDASAHATKIRGPARLAAPTPTLPRLSRLPVRRQLRELWRRQPARVETGTLQ